MAPASSRSGPVQLTLKDKDTTKASTSFTYVDDVQIHNDAERPAHSREGRSSQSEGEDSRTRLY